LLFHGLRFGNSSSTIFEFSDGVPAFLTAQAGHPFDTIKVRLQTDHARRFRGPLDCLTTTVRGEGLRALYKGVTPPLVATGVINSLLFGMQVRPCSLRSSAGRAGLCTIYHMRAMAWYLELCPLSDGSAGARHCGHLRGCGVQRPRHFGSGSCLFEILLIQICLYIV
jgi:hypothetical protein